MAILIALVATCIAACTSADVSRALGARGDRADECDERCLTGGSYPGGFCSLACDEDGACPSDARCVADDGGVCLFACGGDADCTFLGETWRCASRDAQGGGAQVMVCRGP